MNQFRYIILLTICIGLIYGMACFFLQPELLPEGVQILPATATESVRHNIPTVSPSAFTAAVPHAVTPAVASLNVSSVVAPSVVTTSSQVTRSVSGGAAHYASPVVPDVKNRQHATVYAYVATPQHFSSSVSVETQQSAVRVRQVAPQRKAPGTIGGNWEDWLNRYYGDTGKQEGDLSGLNDWWNDNLGGGFTPGNTYDDFYDWAKMQYTPVADATLMLVVLLLLYGVALDKRVRINKLKDE